MKIVYSNRYRIDIGDHVFPTAKFDLVLNLLARQGTVDPSSDVVEPEAASWDDLALVHHADYLEKSRTGGFRPSELAQLEMPWSAGMAEGFRLMAGGSVTAARLAMAQAARLPGLAPDSAERRLAAAAHLGGGFHHAFPDHGEGFCLYNDVALVIRVLQREGMVERAAVVDCDVHHGNGTAFVFRDDPSVFTLSIHQEHNYPAVKPRSSLDIGLADGTRDAEYLRALDRGLRAALASRPGVIVYVAGADPFIEDKLGGLSLTRDGLRARDHQVLEAARDAGVPVVIVLAGGYARRLEDTAAIHAATIEEAARLSA
jgi:acetoin utilization deacetylase AcuC-like enzyme